MWSSLTLFCLCVAPTDESEQVGASGSLEGHAHSRPGATSGDIQDKRQGLLTRACTHKVTPLWKEERGAKPRPVCQRLKKHRFPQMRQ